MLFEGKIDPFTPGESACKENVANNNSIKFDVNNNNNTFRIACLVNININKRQCMVPGYVGIPYAYMGVRVGIPTYHRLMADGGRCKAQSVSSVPRLS